MSKPIKAIVCGAGDMARKHIESPSGCHAILTLFLRCDESTPIRNYSFE